MSTGYRLQRPSRLTLIQDSEVWDRSVLADPLGGFLQSYAWGRQKQHFGWVPVRLGVQGVRGEPLLAQVLFRRIPHTPFTLGYIPRGPLLNYADEEAILRMDRALGVLARRYRAASITWEPPVADSPALQSTLARFALQQARGVQARTTRLIDLSAGLEAATAQQHQKWRYNTRLARRHGVQVRVAETTADLSRWYALMETTGSRDRFGVHSEDYYRRFWLETAPSGATVLLLAEHQGELLAGIMVHRFGFTATYLYGASGNDARALMPNHLLQAEAMRWAASQGVRDYDLFGIADSDDPDEPLAGVTRFKAGWGGTVLRYAGGFDRVYHRAMYAMVQRMRGAGGD